MRRELMKSLRTVALLAILSENSQTGKYSRMSEETSSRNQYWNGLCLLWRRWWRSVPHDLQYTFINWLHLETQRTISVIRALCAVTPAIVCRDVYFAGAKHLVLLLQLLSPAYDLVSLNLYCDVMILYRCDRMIQWKTVRKTFLSLANSEYSITSLAVYYSISSRNIAVHYDWWPRRFCWATWTITLTRSPVYLTNRKMHYSRWDLGDNCMWIEPENLQDSTRDFPDWVASFIRRVIQITFQTRVNENTDDATESRWLRASVQ